MSSARKVAVLSYTDSSVLSKHAERARIVRCNHEAYAQRHNYTYISPVEGSTLWSALHLLGHGTRAKTASLLLHLRTFDYLLWVDADVVFYNRRLSVDPWIDRMDSANADILAASNDVSSYQSEPNAEFTAVPFNAGALLVRGSEWAASFLSKAVPELRARPLDAQKQDQHDTD